MLPFAKKMYQIQHNNEERMNSRDSPLTTTRRKWARFCIILFNTTKAISSQRKTVPSTGHFTVLADLHLSSNTPMIVPESIPDSSTIIISLHPLLINNPPKRIFYFSVQFLDNHVLQDFPQLRIQLKGS